MKTCFLILFHEIKKAGYAGEIHIKDHFLTINLNRILPENRAGELAHKIQKHLEILKERSPDNHFKVHQITAL